MTINDDCVTEIAEDQFGFPLTDDDKYFVNFVLDEYVEGRLLDATGGHDVLRKYTVYCNNKKQDEDE